MPLSSGTSISSFQLEKIASSVVKWTSLALIAVGVVALSGWIIGMRTDSLSPGLMPMKANTALGFVFIGSALWLLRDEAAGRRRRVAGMVLAAVVVLLALMTLAQDLFRVDFAIDQILAQDAPAGGVGSGPPGRMPPRSAACFLLAGVALFLLPFRSLSTGRVIQALSLLGFGLVTMAFAAYLYDLESLLVFRDTNFIAPSSTILFAALFVALIVCRPRHELVTLVLGGEPWSRMVRALLPAAFIFPLAIGWLSVTLIRFGLLDVKSAASASTAALVGAMSAAILWNAHAQRQMERLRRAAEDSVRGIEQEFKEMFDNAPVEMFVKDLQGHYIMANRRFADSLGIPETSLIGRTNEELFPAETARAFTEYDRSVIESGEAIIVEETFQVPSGSRTYLTSLFPLRDGDGVMYAMGGIATDVTHRRELEGELKKAEETIQHYSRVDSVGQLVGGVAHDFNNVLTVILGHSDLLRRRLQDVRLIEHADEITEAAERATHLSRQLLGFSRKHTPHLETISVNLVVRDFEKMLRRLIGDDIELFVHLDEDAGFVCADRHQLEQVLMNLAVNARDAMPEGGVLRIESGRSSFTAADAAENPGIRPGVYVTLSVSDTGVGMDAETKKRLFDPFFTTKDPGRGTGLGLSTTRTILRDLGGNIRVFSEVGLGATFKVYLPLRVAPEPERASATSTTTGGPAARTGRVLIVEEDLPLRQVLTRILSHDGLEVLEAESVDEALNVALSQRGKINLMLIDTGPKNAHAVAQSQQLRDKRPGMRFLHISAQPADVLIAQGIVHPCDLYLAKPFTVEDLLAAVRVALKQTTVA